MTDTSDIKAGSGLPAAEIERLIRKHEAFIETIYRVGAKENMYPLAIQKAVDEETAHLNELKESLNERLAASE